MVASRTSHAEKSSVARPKSVRRTGKIKPPQRKTLVVAREGNNNIVSRFDITPLRVVCQ
jgi:hypothetical protein